MYVCLCMSVRLSVCNRRLKCHICERTVCKTVAGLKRDLRAHGRAVIQ